MWTYVPRNGRVNANKVSLMMELGMKETEKTDFQGEK